MQEATAVRFEEAESLAFWTVWVCYLPCCLPFLFCLAGNTAEFLTELLLRNELLVALRLILLRLLC